MRYYGGYNYYSGLYGALIFVFVIALVCTILTLVLITPEKRRAGLPKFFRFCHDLFNVKWLLIEKILKAIYIFNTLFIFLGGFVCLFILPLMGLLMMFVGPVLVRLLHEALMLGILAVKNLISINNKIPASGTGEDPFSASFSEHNTSNSDVPASAPASNAVPTTVICKNCGAELEPGSLFCGRCGHKNDGI